MKYQQVTVDFVNMVYTACTYLMLAGAAWIFLRLLQACFWLPRHLRKQNDIQQMLQDKVEGYEKYVLECEEKEKKAVEVGGYDENEKNSDEKYEIPKSGPIDEVRWKERRECLEMLKNELKRVRDGGDPYDWDHLLEDEEEVEVEKMGDETNEIEHSVKKEMKTKKISGSVEDTENNDSNVKTLVEEIEFQSEDKKYK